MAKAPVKAGYWLARSGNIADIDALLFTHLFWASASVDYSTNDVIILEADRDEFAQFSRIVKDKNPSVQTLLSIRCSKETLSSMARSENSRKTFIGSSAELARANNFDGLDLYWQSPDTEADMGHLSSLLVEWRRSVPELLLTAAVFVSPNQLKYPAQTMQEKLNWVNVMAMDFTTPTTVGDTTGAPAALFKTDNASSYGSHLVDSLILNGLRAENLVLGLPFYGYAWKLVDSDQHGLNSPAEGPYKDDGSMTYRKIKQSLRNNPDASRVYDQTVVTDYLYKGTFWVGYDGPQSIVAKVSYAKNVKGLRGYVASTLGWDSTEWDLTVTASNAWRVV